MDSNRPCNVIVVDDEPAINQILEKVLEDAGMSVRAAANAQDALTLYKEQQADVVITDIQMSGMSGFDLLAELLLRNPNAKIIMMTGYDSYDVVRRALQEGAYDYLTKPLEDHDLIVTRVLRAFEHVKLIRENANLIKRLQASHAKITGTNRHLVHLSKRLRHLAITDELTQLYNRRFIDQTIQTETEERTRLVNPLSVLLLDVDHFKAFNDKHGHDGGDQALQAVADTMKKCSRPGDLIGRYGGEEFIAVLPGTSEDQANELAETIRGEIKKQAFMFEKQQTHITVSIGVASTVDNEDKVSGRRLIIQADKALYAAKDAGRNCSCHFSELPDTRDNVVPLIIPNAANS